VVVPQQSGEIVAALGEDWQTLDPHVQARIAGWTVHNHIYDTLVEWDANGELVPSLAESWTSIDDRTWEFKLRKGVKFHNGEDFDAESVKSTLERIFDEDLAASLKTFWEEIDDVEIKDGHTVRVRTAEPFGPIFAALTITNITPPSANEQGDDYWNGQPVGTGPFRVEQYEKGQFLELVANTDYWQSGVPNLERLTFRFIQEMSTRMAALLAGEVQFVDRVPPDMIAQIESDSRLQIIHSPSVEAQYIGLNCGREPFNDKRVRQAFNYAVDKQKLIDDLLLGNGTVADAPIAPGVFGYASGKPFEYDLEKAKALVAEAGYADGLPDLELIILKGVYTKGLEVAEAIAGQLKEIGANVSVNDLEPAVHWPRRRDGEYDMAFVGWSCMTRDADFSIYRCYYGGPEADGTYEAPSGEKFQNWLRYRNPDADKYIEAGRYSSDQDERKAAYAEASNMVFDDAPWLWLYFTEIIDAADAQMVGFEQLPQHVKLFRKASLTS
jgi:peptide/nickel transport system substrate-binding protein